MKKFIVFLVVIVLAISLAVPALAAGDIVSPEQGTTTPDVTPEPAPSPQTGTADIAWFFILAIVLLAVTVVVGRKIFTV